MHRLRLLPDGNTLEWIDADEQGRSSSTAEEPDSGWWVRLKLCLQSPVVAARDV